MHITLKDGSTYNVQLISVANDKLNIIFPATFADAYRIFSNADNINTITYQVNNDTPVEYTGYVNIESIFPSIIGGITVVLTR